MAEKFDRDEMIEDLMNCEKCEADVSGVFPCHEHEQKFQEEVEYIMSED